MGLKKILSFRDDMRVEEARDFYMAANGFTVEDYEARTFTVGILGRRLKLPNTAARKRAVPLHDLHHIVIYITL